MVLLEGLYGNTLINNYTQLCCSTIKHASQYHTIATYNHTMENSRQSQQHKGTGQPNDNVSKEWTNVGQQ